VKATLWQRASAFAARAHAGQTRSDGITPYFSHCVRVAMIVSNMFGCRDEAAIAAAFLHDTIEDTLTDLDELETEFGRAVASLVASLTKNKALREDAREREYDRQMAGADWRARLIKLADALDNWCDATSASQRTKALKRCRRAIRLARADGRNHVETAAAIRIVSAAMRTRRR
jgi:guanosine-3',5'-bis(diphosphate) 3'-pyrophosphohydrolase